MNFMKKEGEMVKLNVKAKKILEDIKIGDSIATNGVCLTVTHYDNKSFTVDVMPETVQKTNLKKLRPGSKINLERAITPSTRMGGHFVTGHIDGIGTLFNKKEEEKAFIYTFSISPSISRYMVEKGSVAIDGVSLTTIDVSEDKFSVGLIPLSAETTTLGNIKVGDEVNLETDIIAKYVEKFLNRKEDETRGKNSLSLEDLKGLGY